MIVVRAENIKKDYIRKGKGTNIFPAVKECSITLEKGTFSVVRGRSGSGKSTLISMLSGILEPSSGKVYYDDTDLYGMDDALLSDFRRDHIGFIPQGRSAVASLTLYENIILPFTLFGEEPDHDIDGILERMGISELKDARPSELSGGELRRMAIARAMVRRPDVIFADEPTGDLDDENTEIVLRELRNLADLGTAVMMVTHDAEAEAYADILYRMDAGNILQQP